MSQASFSSVSRGKGTSQVRFRSQLEAGRSGLPLVACPKCGDEILELTSRSNQNPGKIFFKCRKNEQHMPSKCNFYLWRDQYVEFLANSGYSTLCDYGHPVEEVEKLKEGGARVIEGVPELVKFVKLLLLTNVVIIVLVLLCAVILLGK